MCPDLQFPKMPSISTNRAEWLESRVSKEEIEAEEGSRAEEEVEVEVDLGAEPATSEAEEAFLQGAASEEEAEQLINALILLEN